MFRIKYGVALIALAYAGAVLAEDLPEFNGGDVVVTASGVPQTAGIAPVSVTVVTAQDIASSSATSVPQVLATVAGVHLISEGGGSPAVDLRGFGMTASSNTMILLDGVKLNSNDQSSPDLSNIPLSNIERIEIVRGSGSVVYGGGATGGVINIITRTGYQAQNSGSVTQTFGSFRLRQTDANFNLAGDRVSLDGFGHSMYTDHYMQNEAERDDSAGLGLNLKMDQGSARFYVRSSSDRNGIPGSIAGNQGPNPFGSEARTGSEPYDSGTEHTDQAGLNFSHTLGPGQVYFDWSTRTRTTLSTYSGNPDNRKLDESSGNLRYVQPFGNGNQWLAGIDWLNGSATDNGNYYGGLGSVQSLSSSNQNHMGVFSEAQWQLWQGARLTTSGRVQRIDDSFNCNSQNSSTTLCQNSANSDELHAWQLGLRQALTVEWSAYGKLGQSFRLPNSDDLVATVGGLMPQTSHDQELGLEWVREQSRMHVAVFRSDISNEIQYIPFANGVYGPFSGSNVNLSPTRHQGLEFEGNTALTARLSLHGNLTWQQVTFLSGFNGTNLSGDRVPQIPQWLANLGFSWAANDSTRLSLDANLVGSERLDGDQTNQFWTEMPSYTLVNAKLTHQFSPHLSGTLAANNLLNRHYATYAIVSSGTAFNFVPGDPRNYQASVSWSF